jgi:hypothetical protein
MAEPLSSQHAAIQKHDGAEFLFLPLLSGLQHLCEWNIDRANNTHLTQCLLGLT